MIELLPWLLLGVVAVVALALWWRSRRDVDARSVALAARIESLAAAGDPAAAAKLAQDAGRLDVAFDLYLRARDPASAAAVAVRRGDLRRAANLYEQVGNWERAVALYDQVGLHRHAESLRTTRLAEETAALPAAAQLVAPVVAATLARTREPTPAPAPEPAPTAVPMSVPALAPAPASMPTLMIGVAEPPPAIVHAPPPAAALVDVPPPAAPAFDLGDLVDGRRRPSPSATHAAAGALLAQGDITGAAELFAELGLDDEATHLWVNVLGAPERAASLVAVRGNHERAAELYALAGNRERAAMEWVDAARASATPESYLERIGELSTTVALAYLEQELASRPLSARTAEWHYQKARVVERDGDARRAVTLYLEVQDALGSYRDVDERVAALTRALQPPSATSRTRRTSREPIELPPDLAPAPVVAATEPIELPPPAIGPLVPAAATPAAPGPSIEVAHDELQRLAAQVADAAVDKVRRRSRLSTLPVTDPLPPRERPAEPLAVGLERGPIEPARLDDGALEVARRGPTLDALLHLVGDRPCGLDNIEVFYRIGLAHQAGGNFEGALHAFAAVDEVSPGYRDASRRVEDLQAWQRAMSPSTRLAASDEPGERERYELRGELGRGRLAVVYRAFDHGQRRDVALKLLSGPLSSQRPVLDSFQRRSRAAATLGHPNLVSVRDSGVLRDRAFLAMELVDGQPADALLREPGGLSIVEALRIMKQVLDGLAAMHAAGVLHHDVRPASIVRTTSGLVKLMDPGLVIPRDGGPALAVIGGSPAHLSPELLRGADEIDARADVFAASVTLYELLSGKLPYRGGDRQHPPVRLATLAPALPAQLEAAIMRGIAIDREQRWRAAAELGSRIASILHAIDSYVANRRRQPPS